MSTWLTRAQASDLLGCAVTTLVTWERKGRLHPGKRLSFSSGQSYVTVYDPDELRQMPRKFRGEFSAEESEARCFELFAEGTSLANVVIRTRIGIKRVRELHADWLDTGGAENVINPAARLELARMVGHFADVTELVERVRSAITMNAAASTMSGSQNENTTDLVTIEVDLPASAAHATDIQIDQAISAALDHAESKTATTTATAATKAP